MSSDQADRDGWRPSVTHSRDGAPYELSQLRSVRGEHAVVGAVQRYGLAVLDRGRQSLCDQLR
ncbi:MAG TPA: hypothetical protein VHT52_15055, partial [Stellaceae bacterium]|nr:hypothetical protein [Stellaceae bacterium]